MTRVLPWPTGWPRTFVSVRSQCDGSYPTTKSTSLIKSNILLEARRGRNPGRFGRCAGYLGCLACDAVVVSGCLLAALFSSARVTNLASRGPKLVMSTTGALLCDISAQATENNQYVALFKYYRTNLLKQPRTISMLLKHYISRRVTSGAGGRTGFLRITSHLKDICSCTLSLNVPTVRSHTHSS